LKVNVWAPTPAELIAVVGSLADWIPRDGLRPA
jgi:hypothetical protein